MKGTDHISADRLQEYLDHELDPSGLQDVKLHLEQCPACRNELSRLEGVFTRLENLPAVELDQDISKIVLDQLRQQKMLPQGITWTLALEALGAGTVIGLLIPAFQATAWLPILVDTRIEVQAGINIFMAQLASSWVVWWAGLRLNIELTTRSLINTSYFPRGEFSPWILILAAAGIGILANFILLQSTPARSRNHLP